MNLPFNYEERINIVDRTTHQETFTFKEILDWESKKMLQEGDHFIIDKDGDYWFSIVYINGDFYAVTSDPKLVKISRDELSQYKYYNKNLIESSYQEFIKREGLEKFNQLSLQDKCDVYIGNYFVKRVNDLLDGLKNTLSSLVDTLKEDKEESKN